MFKKASIGDIIVLYENKVGHIYRGIYGKYNNTKIGSEIAPDCNITVCPLIFPLLMRNPKIGNTYTVWCRSFGLDFERRMVRI